ncbi:hypothetical protein WN943_008588 [Citrus x changshan-huyou]
MATASILKANSLLYSKKWKNKLRCHQPGGLAIKFDKFTASTRLEGVKVESFTKSAYSTAVVACSSSKSNLSEKSVTKRWRIPALAHVSAVMPLPAATVCSCNCGKNFAAAGDADNSVVKNEQSLLADLKDSRYGGWIDVSSAE